MIRPLYRYILMAAVRDRFFFAIVGILAVVISLSLFFGSSALTEQDQFARSFAAFGFRLFGVVILVLFIVGYLRRSFEGRDIDYLLSRPMGRVSFVLTHAAAFSTLGILAALLLGGTTMLLQWGAINSSAFLWGGSLAAEFIIMANVAMFFAFVMRSASACIIVVFAFYLLSRLMGEILGILQKAATGPAVQILSNIMEAISVFVPRLDLMAQSKWLLYGVQADLSPAFVFGQCGIFTALVIGATLLDMHRRQF